MRRCSPSRLTTTTSIPPRSCRASTRSQIARRPIPTRSPVPLRRTAVRGERRRLRRSAQLVPRRGARPEARDPDHAQHPDDRGRSPARRGPERHRDAGSLPRGRSARRLLRPVPRGRAARRSPACAACSLRSAVTRRSTSDSSNRSGHAPSWPASSRTCCTRSSIASPDPRCGPRASAFASPGCRRPNVATSPRSSGRSVTSPRPRASSSRSSSARSRRRRSAAAARGRGPAARAAN